MEQPSDPQQAIFRQIVQHAGNLASVLEAQFECCRTEPEEFCQECFDIEVIGDVERLPNEVECPFSFSVHESGLPDGTGALGVLLWHEEGLVTGVEVNSVTHPHAALTDLMIVE